MFMIELSLLIVVCVSINNPNKKCIIVSFINKVVLTIYVATLSFYCFMIFKYIYRITLIIFVLLVLVAFLTLLQ